MIGVVSNMLIAFGVIVAIGLVVAIVWIITTSPYNKKNKSFKDTNTLSLKDNLVDTVNKNYKPVKDYYEVYVYLNPSSTQKLIYRIHSHSDWKEVSTIYHNMIRVYLKHKPLGYSDSYIDYELSEYTVGNTYGIHSFMRSTGLDETDITTLYSNNKNVGYIGLRKISKRFYDINILQDVGIDRYIYISFNCFRNLKDDSALNKLVQKVLI